MTTTPREHRHCLTRARPTEPASHFINERQTRSRPHRRPKAPAPTAIVCVRHSPCRRCSGGESSASTTKVAAPALQTRNACSTSRVVEHAVCVALLRSESSYNAVLRRYVHPAVRRGSLSISLISAGRANGTSYRAANGWPSRGTTPAAGGDASPAHLPDHRVRDRRFGVRASAAGRARGRTFYERGAPLRLYDAALRLPAA